MKSLFSETGLKILESLTFTRTLYAFDFDGTLAPIVSSPEDARASKLTEKLLSELSKLVPVAIVSGRSIQDLKSNLSVQIPFLIGNHGLEGLGENKESIEYAEKTCKRWAADLSSKLSALDALGIQLEDKKYSLALHYRKSRNKKEARLKLFTIIQELDPAPRMILGKCVMNLVPAGAPHKGVALLELMLLKNMKCAFYIGDDDTDEDVFSLPDNRIISTRVGKKKNSQAQFYIERQTEINRLLKSLIRMQKSLQK